MHAREVARVDTGTLWERFHGELHAFLRSRVGSDEAAQDLLQTAFLRAHTSLAAGVVPEHPRAWLYQIVRNLMIDSRRQDTRQENLAVAVARAPAPGGTSDADTQEAFAVVARALPMFIDALDPIYRDALTMTELEGLTQVEAAKRARISLSGMKSRVQRGRQHVFKSLRCCCEFRLDARGHMIACTSRGHDDACCSVADE